MSHESSVGKGKNCLLQPSLTALRNETKCSQFNTSGTGDLLQLTAIPALRAVASLSVWSI